MVGNVAGGGTQTEKMSWVNSEQSTLDLTKLAVNVMTCQTGQRRIFREQTLLTMRVHS